MTERCIRCSILGFSALVLAATTTLGSGATAGSPPDPFAAMNAARAVREVPVPAFRLQTMEGRPLALEDLRGKVVLFYYWRTW